MQAGSPPIVAFVFGFGLATALAAVCAIFLHPNDVQEYKFWSQEAAGWAQAAGTILAIVATYATSILLQRHAKAAENRAALKKSRALSHFFAPAIRTIESDVTELLNVSKSHQNIGIRDFRKFDVEGFRFRPIPNVELILNNAHNFPEELSVTIPQLLGFRAITDTSLSMIVERTKKTGYIDGTELKSLLGWLERMQTLIEEIYRDMPSVHD